jgi:glycosyltransferase involved in cell wall biosynthesis
VLAFRRMLAVTVDASALDDARGTAGIGRYVRCLVDNLGGVADLSLSVARPGRRPPHEAWVVRWANAQPAVLRTAVRHRAALVHATATDPAAPWPLRRQVVTVHDVVPWADSYDGGHPANRVYLAWQRRRFRRCAGVVAVSDAVAAEAIAALRLDERRLTVVPEGVPPAFVAAVQPDDVALRRAAGIAEPGYVLWTGSLVAHDPRKALDVLLDAVVSVAAGRPGTRLVLAGRQGEAARTVSTQAARLGLDVAMPGYVPDATLAALVRGAGVVALPSRHEGFGLPALEAMACGVPLVVGRAGNLPGLVSDAALLVEPGDVAGLAAALRAALDDPAVAGRLRDAGPRRAAPYSWQRTAEATVEVYRRAVQR